MEIVLVIGFWFAAGCGLGVLVSHLDHKEKLAIIENNHALEIAKLKLAHHEKELETLTHYQKEFEKFDAVFGRFVKK